MNQKFDAFISYSHAADIADADGTMIETNPPPVVGSAHVSGPDNKIRRLEQVLETSCS